MNKNYIINLLNEAINELKEDNYNTYYNMTTTIEEPENIRDKIVRLARSYIGKIPYKYGGKDKTGIDCSGFVQMVLTEAGVCPTNVLTNSAGMQEWGKETHNPKPGDIICYDGHVAIYSGNKKIIDAGSKVKGISERDANIITIKTIRNIVGD